MVLIYQICVHICIIYQGCTRTGTERQSRQNVGTELPYEERTENIMGPERSGTERIFAWDGTDRTGTERSGDGSGTFLSRSLNALRQFKTEQPESSQEAERNGPEWAAWNKQILERTGTGRVWNAARFGPDRNGPERYIAEIDGWIDR